MYIANPIYDTVFKHLMEDNQIAKVIIGTIIGRKILELDARPQERSVIIEDYTLTFFRLDYKALVETETGERLKILIELQKAAHLEDIERFRRYLGENYKTPEIVGDEKITLPIINIYLLGDKLNATFPFIKVSPDCYDILTGKRIVAEDNFIKLLNHESYFIQIRRLDDSMQHKLERLLSVFNQKRITSHKDRWILEYTDLQSIEDEDLKNIAKRLAEVLYNEEMLERVRMEEEVENELDKILRQKREAEEKAQVAEEKVQVAEEKAQAAEEKAEEERKQKEEERKQKEEERKQKEEAILQTQNAARKMLEAGMSKESIALMFTISLEKLEEWIKH